MTYDAGEIDETSGAPEQVCALCHHSEEDHVMREAEPNAATETEYCLACDDWHAFIPEPEV
jgi:hypothetical protein